MDNFKKYTRERRDAMDTDIPSDAVWERVTKDLPPANARIIPLVIRCLAAACVVGLIVMAVFITKEKNDKISPSGNVIAVNEKNTILDTAHLKLYEKNEADSFKYDQEKNEKTIAFTNSKFNNGKQKNFNPAKVKQGLSTDQILLQDLQTNYAQLVAMQVNHLNSMPVYATSPGYFQSFKDQFRSLDSSEVDLRRTIKSNGLNGEFLEQLINLYQLKLNVLKTLQSEINKINNKVIGEQPKDSIKTFYINI